MADPRLIPPGINDERARILTGLMDGPGTLNLVPLLVNHFDTVPAQTLPLLIEQYALKEFTTDDMPELAVRRLLKKGLLLHRFRGSRFAVEEALSVAGIRAQIIEWFEDGGTGQPYTFQVTAYVKENLDAATGQPVLNAKTLSRAIRLINASKRASVTYDLILAVEVETTLKLAAIVEFAAHSNVHLTATPRPVETTANVAAIGILDVATHADVHLTAAPPPVHATAPLGAAMAVRGDTTVFLTLELTAP